MSSLLSLASLVPVAPACGLTRGRRGLGSLIASRQFSFERDRRLVGRGGVESSDRNRTAPIVAPANRVLPHRQWAETPLVRVAFFDWESWPLLVRNTSRVVF